MFFFVFSCVVFMFPKKKKIGLGGQVGGVWPIRVFSRIFGFFQLDKTPKHMSYSVILITQVQILRHDGIQKAAQYISY